MGECIFCGQPAGWFKDRHPDCEDDRNQAMNRLTTLAASAFAPGADMRAVAAEAEASRNGGRITRDDYRSLLISAWADALRRYSDDGAISREEEARLLTFREAFALRAEELDGAGRAWTSLGRALLLRDLREGIIDARFDPGGFDRVNLQPGERIAWIFSGVDLVRQKTVRSSVGRSTGISVRVMKGVYLRQSMFRSDPVERTQAVTVDRGHAVFTDRNLYFAGGATAWRLPWGKIVSMTPYRDGLGVIKDGANAKADVLVTGDGLFAYNMAQALADIAAAK